MGQALELRRRRIWRVVVRIGDPGDAMPWRGDRFESARLPNPDPAMKIRIGCDGWMPADASFRRRAGSGMATMKWLARQE